MAKALFIGAVHEALAAFDALCASQDVDVSGVVTLKSTGAASGGCAVDISTSAERRGITTYILPDVNRPLRVDDVVPFSADLAFVVGWNRLVPQPVLDVFPLGVYGFHASALPKDRGRAPVNWAIIKGYTRTANTMMRLSAGVDLGDMIDQRFTPIFYDDTCATVYARIAELGAQMIISNLPAILAGRPSTIRQTPSEGNYLPKRTPDMGVIDWTMTPSEIHNWIRAQTSPYPGAFSELDGRRVSVWSSRPPSVKANLGGGLRPGTIVDVAPDRVVVQAELGTISLTSLTWAGGSPVDHDHLDVGGAFSQPASEWTSWAKGLGARPDRLLFGDA
jgi:methionyl-tRNA formyltransferase